MTPPPPAPVTTSRKRWRVRALAVAAAGLGLVFAATLYWRDDILRTKLDPKQPYQTYRPPAAPDYARRDAWALLPADPAHSGAGDPPADVFFVHPTTYDGGRDWNGPIDDAESRRILETEMLPNYAEPYRRVGRLWAPRYRQASLYARLTLREDALDARRFAYQDVRAAFDAFLAREGSSGRPLVIVGVEQGGRLASRLAGEVAADPRLAPRLAAVHLVQTPEPSSGHGPGAPLPACRAPQTPGCVLAFAAAPEFDLGAEDRIAGKAAVWTVGGGLEPLGRRPFLCVNPVTGALDRPSAPESQARGAANATGLEAGARPPLLPAQAATRCDHGLLRYTAPRSPTLTRAGDWAQGLRAAPFNLFWADLEADAQRRVAAWSARAAAPPPA